MNYEFDVIVHVQTHVSQHWFNPILILF